MCALDAMGRLHCWGKPASNPLYEGLLELTEVRGASIGSRFGCALTDNHVVCVGENDEGQLGDGRLLQSTRAIEMPRPEGGPL
jgi:hypothetical protein